MTKNTLLVSSDHHANWDCLDALFSEAKKRNIPFIINGDIVGDYHFDKIVKELNIKSPYEITGPIYEEILGIEGFNLFKTSKQIKNHSVDEFLKQFPQEERAKTKEEIEKIIEQTKSKDFLKKIEIINSRIKDIESVISSHKINIKKLFDIIIEKHAKIFADMIDKYKVKTYFLNGNHEPIYFPDLVKKHLKNKEFFVDIGSEKGILNINGIKTCGVSNVNALMSYLNEIFTEKDLDNIFIHQRGSREILYKNIKKEILHDSEKLNNDFDWIRIMGNKKSFEFDLFLSHGQIGEGAWRSDKKCPESPTLYVAGCLSELAKLTIDGHLHTTHEMKNILNKPTLRAVGNKGYIIHKTNNDELFYKLINTNTEYKQNNGIKLNIDEIKKELDI